MWLFKKKTGEPTGFKKFIKKISGSIPEVLNVAGTLASGNLGGAISEVKNILIEKSQDDVEAKKALNELEENERSWLLEVFNSEIEDRKSARGLFRYDDVIQKVFAIAFLIGYCFLSWYLLEIIKGNTHNSELLKTMITMIWTGTSTKLGTIVDFFFGGSLKK